MSRAKRAIRLIGNATKILLVIFVFSVTAFLVWRAFISVKLPSEVADIHIDGSDAAIIKADGGLEGAFRQEQRSTTSNERTYGYFSAVKTVFLPSLNEIQVLARYNNSTLRATQSDYGLESAPEREGEVYDITLVMVLDKTPENKDDNLENGEGLTEEIRIFPKKCDSATANMYNYRRLVFELGEYDLEKLLDEGILLSVFADFYYVEDIDYSKKPYAALCLYDYVTETVPYEPTKNEKKLIEEILAN